MQSDIKIKSNKTKNNSDLVPRTLKYENTTKQSIVVKSPIKNSDKKKSAKSRDRYDIENLGPLEHKASPIHKDDNINQPLDNKSQLIVTPKKVNKNENEPQDHLVPRDGHQTKPNESPFTEFCRGLSPIQNHLASPNLLFKTASIPLSIMKYKTPSPMTFHFQDMNQSPFNPFTNKKILKLDFACSKIILKQNQDEINVEPEQHNPEDIDQNNNPDFDDNLVCKESMTESPNFNFAIKRSIYGGSNSLPNKPISFLPQQPPQQQSGQSQQPAQSSETPKNFNSSQRFSDQSTELESQEKSKNPEKGLQFNFSTPVNSNKIVKKLLLNSMNSFSGKDVTIEGLFSGKGKNISAANLNSPSDSSVKKKEEEEEGPQKSVKKKVCCNCKKSRCLKLYCDCFAAGEYCQDCNCTSCANNDGNSNERNNAILATLDRNPQAFKPKVDKTENSFESEQEKIILQQQLDNKSRHIKGCNCKKSACLKKYCECFQAGVKCSELCKCEACKNMDPSTLMKKAQNLGYLANFNSQSDNYKYESSQTQNDYTMNLEKSLKKSIKEEEGEADNEETHTNHAHNQQSASNNNASRGYHHTHHEPINDEYYHLIGGNSSKKQKIDNFNSFQSSSILNEMMTNTSTSGSSTNAKGKTKATPSNEMDQNPISVKIEERRTYNTRKESAPMLNNVSVNANFASPYSKKLTFGEKSPSPRKSEVGRRTVRSYHSSGYESKN